MFIRQQELKTYLQDDLFSTAYYDLQTLVQSKLYYGFGAIHPFEKSRFIHKYGCYFITKNIQIKLMIMLKALLLLYPDNLIQRLCLIIIIIIHIELKQRNIAKRIQHAFYFVKLSMVKKLNKPQNSSISDVS